MGAVYATVADVQAIGRPLTAAEQEQAGALLPIASSLLRQEASKRGHDLDSMIADNSDIGDIAKLVTVNSTVRALNASADSAPAAVQASQAGLGFSVSATYQNPGQPLYFLRNELKELGLLRQTFGAVEVFKVYDGTNA